MQPFFGYPGGKSRAVAKIVGLLEIDELEGIKRIVEPFCGGASMSLYMLERTDWTILLNDLDADLISLWSAALDYTDEFVQRIQDAEPTAEMFYTLKETLQKKRPMDWSKKAVLKRGLEKLIAHKISFSSMAEMSGAPVGGREQQGNWKFDTRWNPECIGKTITRLAEYSGRITLRCGGYKSLRLKQTDLVFVDPPYVIAGPKCYKHNLDDKGHEALAEWLGKADFTWVLTYDDVEIIRSLYAKFKVIDYKFLHLMTTTSRKGQPPKGVQELLITNLT